MSATNERALSWNATYDWRAPSRRIDWDAASAWSTSFQAVIAADHARLVTAIARWDERLASIGGDPSQTDWSEFRPLRLSREEDWSDWLAHLLATCRSGCFAARMFGHRPDDPAWIVERVGREIAAEGYRADLVVHYRNDEWMHVEVKVGDLELGKTVGTGQALRRNFGGVCRGDVLLLPREDEAAWEPICVEQGERARAVQVVTWHDVARALRMSVVEQEHESTAWRVWALTFLGAVEQRLLGLPPVVRAANAQPSARDLEWIRYLASMEAER